MSTMDLPVRAEGARLVWRGGGETLVVEPWGRDSVRVRATLMGDVVDTDHALLPLDDVAQGPAGDGAVPGGAEVPPGEVTRSAEGAAASGTDVRVELREDGTHGTQHDLERRDRKRNDV